MTSRVTVLVNLLILVVTFFVAGTTTGSQVRVLRATSRAAFDAPVRAPSPRPPARVERVVRAGGVDPVRYGRLLRFLDRVPGVSRLTAAQVRALCGAVDRCRVELARQDAALRRERWGGAQAWARSRDLRGRLEAAAEDPLARAGVPAGALRRQLVRIAVACAG